MTRAHSGSWAIFLKPFRTSGLSTRPTICLALEALRKIVIKASAYGKVHSPLGRLRQPCHQGCTVNGAYRRYSLVCRMHPNTSPHGGMELLMSRLDSSKRWSEHAPLYRLRWICRILIGCLLLHITAVEVAASSEAPDTLAEHEVWGT